MKKIFIYLWELPQSIIILIYRIYMVFMTIYYSDAVALELEDEDETEKFHNEKEKEFRKKYREFLISFSFFYWFTNLFSFYKIYRIYLIS